MAEQMALADAVEMLRAELVEAMEKGKDAPIQFAVGETKLTVSVVVSDSLTGGGKIRWLVVEAGAEAARSSEATHTIEVTLQPQRVLPDGRRVDLTVGAADTEP